MARRVHELGVRLIRTCLAFGSYGERVDRPEPSAVAAHDAGGLTRKHMNLARAMNTFFNQSK